MMYTIIKCLDGKFYCEGRVQDGIERWEELTLRKAIGSMQVFADVGNHDKEFTEKSITFKKVMRIDKSEIHLVDWNPYEKDEDTTLFYDPQIIASLFLAVMEGDLTALDPLADYLKDLVN